MAGALLWYTSWKSGRADEALKERYRLQTERDALTTQNEQLRKALNQLQQDIEHSGESRLQNQAQKVVPLSSQVKLRASQESKGNNQITFRLWVEGSPDALKRIDKVLYTFDHPTMPWKYKDSTNPNGPRPFEVSYDGWGCLSPVYVTFTQKDGTDLPKVPFDMCAALGIR